MDFKKLSAGICAVMMSVAVLASCGESESGSKAEKSSSKAAADDADSQGEQILTPDEDKPPETDEEWEQAMFKKALVSYGNAGPMQRVIEKAQRGEEVTIAYLGGSITEGISAGPDLCKAFL